MCACEKCLYNKNCQYLLTHKTAPDECTAFKSSEDFVEVVRCRYCVNNPRISTKTKGMVWCRKFRSEVRPDDFCSYGERREENAID